MKNLVDFFFQDSLLLWFWNLLGVTDQDLGLGHLI